MINVSLNNYIEQTKSFKPTDDLPTSLMIDDTGDIQTYFAPFEHINKSAKVVICGITPGIQQATIALESAGQALRDGKTVFDAQRLAKSTASFAGPMRKNLISMLDHIGLHKKLGLSSNAELFGSQADLVHYTSALRNPVFRKGKNYNGSPSMISHPSLRWQVDHYLTEEASLLKEAVWIPLGQKVADVLSYLADKGIIEHGRILNGLPHPSGANAERISIFLGKKEPHLASIKTNSSIVLEGRDMAITTIKALAVE